MQSKAGTLNQSKRAKNDEFYTLYRDVADELSLYKEQFRGRRILCPCDRDDSPFVKFLASHADDYGVKSITASGFDSSSMKGVKFQDIDYGKCDLVITNPPFSLFREFIQTMFNNKLKFLLIGPANAMTYKDVFVHVVKNEMWLGYHHHLTGFALPDGTILPKHNALVRYCCWYTNLDVSYRHNRITLTEKYDPNMNPPYCNFDGIDIKKTAKIPYDYSGNMGVPITFMQKYNPDQFELVGSSQMFTSQVPASLRGKIQSGRFYIQTPEGGFQRLFDRIVIRNKMVCHDS